MKKLIYGGLFLALVGIGFVGCDKIQDEHLNKNNQIDELDNSQVKTSSFGYIGDTHNSLLTDYFTNGNYSDTFNLSELLMDFFDYHSAKNPEFNQFEDLYIDAIENFQNAENVSELYSGILMEMEELKSEGKVNQSDFNILSGVLTSTNNNHYPITLSDNDMAEAFNSVYQASSVFWTNGLGSDLLDIRYPDDYILLEKDPGARAIVGDAIGGALWWWTTWAAPLIAGAYSLGFYYS